MAAAGMTLDTPSPSRIPPEQVTDDFIIAHSSKLEAIYEKIQRKGEDSKDGTSRKMILISTLSRGKVFPNAPGIDGNGKNFFEALKIKGLVTIEKRVQPNHRIADFLGMIEEGTQVSAEVLRLFKAVHEKSLKNPKFDPLKIFNNY